jgi:hypothetical protein
MVSLMALGLPIVLSAVIVFIASSVMHTVLKYHHSEIRKLNNEDKVMEVLRGAGAQRGIYVFPYCLGGKEMKNPEMIEKYKQGPVGMLTVFPSGQPVMGKFLGQWFGYCLLVSFFVAYLTGHTVAPGTPYLAVFRVAGTAGFMTYGLGQIVNGIWKGQPWSGTIKEVADGLVYGLLTAGAFGWLWPK